jgi:hypothetical protein
MRFVDDKIWNREITFLWLEHMGTNESIEAVIAGLDPKEDDVILANGGSFDIPVAILEYGARVIVVDSNHYQTLYCRLRARMLQEKDYQGFLRGIATGKKCEIFMRRGPREFAAESVERRNNYFAQPGRLDRIAGMLNKLEILDEADIFEIAPKISRYDKAFLSNCIGYDGNSSEGAQICLLAIANTLPQGGLIYVSNGENAGSKYSYDNFSLVEHRPLTEAAQTLEPRWHPKVFAKVAP